MESGWDPEVKKYFKKILNTISIGMFWLLTVVTAGIYFKLGFAGERPIPVVILFYIMTVAGFALLVYYYVRLWKK